MKCLKCNFDNPSEMQFCGKCGSRLIVPCPKCGSVNPPEFQFCGKCGTKIIDTVISTPTVSIPKLEDMQRHLQDKIPQSLADKLFAGAKQMQGEYRFVTALFADVSGSSTMARNMSLEQYVDIMDECFKMMVDVISIKYEGSINRFIGDCVLAFFGAPITHENDAERAILAALDIRDAVKELNLNISIGINTGTTYFGEMGSDLTYSERSAWGPDVDFAKRLQEAAEPGQIFVGAASHRLNRRAFDFDKAVDIDVKGSDRTQTAYPVIQANEHPEKLRGIEGLRARMIGREREFSDLKDAVDNLISGTGNIVSIIGEAGFGKSRLSTELKEYLKGKEVQYYEGRCISIGQTVSYWPFIDILKTYLNLSNTDSESEVARKLRESTTALFSGKHEDILSFLGHLLSVRFGDELDEKIRYFTPEQIRHQTLMRLRGVFNAISKQKPLLLILEDLHWADDLSLDLLSLLMDELAENPIMLLCIYRPEKTHRCWQINDIASRKCLDRYTDISLKKLTAHQSRELVESLLEIDNLPEATKGLILKKSEGNPFFIEEVIRYLIDRDIVYREEDKWIARNGIEHIDVPDTIQSVLLSRVDRLEAETRYILQCASVIGRLFRYKLLDHISQQEMNLDKHLSELEEQELIFAERTVPEMEYAFKHALTQEATYQGILERRRKEFHNRIAEGIENLYKERIEEFYEELAYHYNHSGNKEKALEYLIKAGEKSKELYANEATIRFYKEASELLKEMGPEADPQRISVYEVLGDMHGMFGRTSAGKEMYEQGLKYCHTSKQQANFYLKLVDSVRYTISHEAAYEYLNLAKAELDQEPDALLLADYYGALGGHQVTSMGYTQQNISQAMEYAKQGLQVLEGTIHYEKIAGLCGFITWLCISNRHDGASAMIYANKGYEAAQLSGNLKIQADAQRMSGAVEATYGDMDKGIQMLEESLQQNKKIGNPWEIMGTNKWLGFYYFAEQRWDDLIRTYAEGLVNAKELEVQPYHIFLCQCGLGLAYAAKGDLLNLMPICDEFFELNEKGESKMAPFYAHAFLTEAYLKAGQSEKANFHLGQLHSLEMLSLEEIFRNKIDGPNPWFGFLINHWLDKDLFLSEALNMAQKVATGGDDTPIITLGAAYAKNGQFTSALEQFQRVLIGNPRNIMAWRRLRDLALQSPYLSEWETFFAQMDAKAMEDEVVQAEIQKTKEILQKVE